VKVALIDQGVPKTWCPKQKGMAHHNADVACFLHAVVALGRLSASRVALDIQVACMFVVF
jgi:hypothetical protein